MAIEDADMIDVEGVLCYKIGRGYVRVFHPEEHDIWKNANDLCDKCFIVTLVDNTEFFIFVWEVNGHYVIHRETANYEKVKELFNTIRSLNSTSLA